MKCKHTQHDQYSENEAKGGEVVLMDGFANRGNLSHANDFISEKPGAWLVCRISTTRLKVKKWNGNRIVCLHRKLRPHTRNFTTLDGKICTLFTYFKNYRWNTTPTTEYFHLRAETCVKVVIKLLITVDKTIKLIKTYWLHLKDQQNVYFRTKKIQSSNFLGKLLMTMHLQTLSRT